MGQGFLVLRAAASVHHHPGQHAVDDVEIRVEVQHRDGRHLPGSTTGARRPLRVRLLDQMRVRVLLQEDVRALAAAVVGLVPLRRDDPVPAELLEVHRQRVPAAADFVGVLFAVQADHALRATVTLLFNFGLDEGLLENKKHCS